MRLPILIAMVIFMSTAANALEVKTNNKGVEVKINDSISVTGRLKHQYQSSGNSAYSHNETGASLVVKPSDNTRLEAGIDVHTDTRSYNDWSSTTTSPIINFGFSWNF